MDKTILDFRMKKHPNGTVVKHIFSMDEYVIQSNLGRNPLGVEAYYAYRVTDPNKTLSTIDSSEIALDGDAIIGSVAYWKSQMIKAGKDRLVIAKSLKQDEFNRLLAWYISDHNEYVLISKVAAKNKYSLLYYFSLPNF